ncbi:hypothetical protein T4B_269, partial [Trichinella pseudospiralis]
MRLLNYHFYGMVPLCRISDSWSKKGGETADKEQSRFSFMILSITEDQLVISMWHQRLLLMLTEKY